VITVVKARCSDAAISESLTMLRLSPAMRAARVVWARTKVREVFEWGWSGAGLRPTAVFLGASRLGVARCARPQAAPRLSRPVSPSRMP